MLSRLRRSGFVIAWVGLYGCGSTTERAPGQARPGQLRLGRAQQALSTGIVLSASADASLRETERNRNFGREDTLDLGHALVRFDDAELRAAGRPGAQLVSAKLDLVLARRLGREAQVRAFRLTHDWTEGGATWECAVDRLPLNHWRNCRGATRWHMQGGAPPYGDVATSAISIAADRTGRIRLDVTEDVRRFWSGAETSYGWLIESPGEVELGALVARETGGGPTLTLEFAGAACAAGACVSAAPVCGDNVLDLATEQCDGTALPPGAAPGSRCDPRCRLLVPGAPEAPAPRCGDGIINQALEQCDGSSLPPLTPAGSVCNSACQLDSSAARCGDGIINQPLEQCDGAAFPDTLPGGGVCTSDCLLANPVSTCRSCVQDNCAEVRAEVDADLDHTDPILDCMLGPNWPRATRVPAGRCGNASLPECYCGPISISYCVSAPPDTLGGDCTNEMLVGMDCTTSDCVGVRFSSPDNANGKAIQYASCLHDYCFDECLTSLDSLCGDGVINGPREQCDGDAVPAGRTCRPDCSLVPQAVRCGDGIINQPSEQCDGAAMPVPVPPGLRCAASCLLVAATSQ